MVLVTVDKTIRTHSRISKPFLVVGIMLIIAVGASFLHALMPDIPTWYRITRVYPKYVHVQAALTGDTLLIGNSLKVGLIGVSAPSERSEDFRTSTDYAALLTTGRDVVLEYDTLQKDPNERLLGYIWIPCTPVITSYCRGDRALLNEIMIKQGYAQKMTYQELPHLKYDAYLSTSGIIDP